jgi:hypothetical protein
MSETDTRTATQKIEDLEKVVTMLYQAVAQIKPAVENLLSAQGDMALVKDALKLLNKKTEAIIQVAAAETGITVASVSDVVVKMNVEDLKAQVAGYLANGHLVAATEVADDSFMVCEESDAEGKLVNPRIQFRLDSRDEATKAALKGKKVGDTVSFGEGKFNAKLLEVYTIVPPKAPEAAAAAVTAATEVSTEVPAVTMDATPAETTPDTAAEAPAAEEATA